MADSTGSSAVDTTPAPLTQRLGGEALGTLLFVLIGCAASIPFAALGGEDAGLGATFSASAFGFALVAATFAFGRLTGGHFNPAVSIGAAFSGRISWKDAGAYIGAQVGGAVVAGILLLLFSITNDGEFFDENLGVSAFGDQGGAELLSALLVEIVLTLVFVLVYLALTDRRNAVYAAGFPLAVGLAVAAIYSTGASINPARSIGPALFSGSDPIIQLWLFILGPVIGAAAAGFAYNAIFGADRDKVPGSGLDFGGPKQPAQQQWGQPGGYQQGYAPGYQQPGQPSQQYGQPGQPSQQYGQPDPNAGYGAPQAQAAPQPAAEQPIIQDGWQWDPQAQQWIPAPQDAPQAPQQGSWPASGEQTQVRPNDGQ